MAEPTQRHGPDDPPRAPFSVSGRGWLIPDAPGGVRSARAWQVLVPFAIGVVILVGIADFLTGARFSMLLFYLAPVVLVSWFGGIGPGAALSASSAVAWLLSRSLVEGSLPDVMSYWNSFEKFGIFLVVAYVVSMQSALRRLLEREKELSRTDSLTGLMNRRAFNEQVEAEIVRARRYGRPFSLAYMDLDDFKEINDAYGHDAGDRVLRTVARTLDGSLRSTDFVARLGGDEFAILLPETGVEAAAGVMGKARERMEGIRGPGGSSVNASIGVFTCEKPPDSSDRLLTMADALMYSAKKKGKNRILQEVLS